MAVDTMQASFRVLNNWIIEYETEAEYKGQVSVSNVANIATLYGLPEGEKEPEDFLLHEFLHLAFYAVKRLPEDKHQQAEEELIQDICKLFRKK